MSLGSLIILVSYFDYLPLSYSNFLLHSSELITFPLNLYSNKADTSFGGYVERNQINPRSYI